MKTFCFITIIVLTSIKLGAHIAKDGEPRDDWSAGHGFFSFILYMLLFWGAGLFDNP